MSQPQPGLPRQCHGQTRSGRFSPNTKVTAVVLLAGVLPWLAALVARSLFPGSYIREFLHGCVELAGACIAFAVATLLWLRSQYEKDLSHLPWAAAALVAMGLMDGVHAVAPFGFAWSWLRHGATLLGGLLFAAVWLSPRSVSVQRTKSFLMWVAVVSLAAAAFVCSKPHLMPAPFSAGDYTLPARVTNAVGGLAFLAATAFFLRRYLRRPQAEDLVLASQTLLFAVAGVLFGYSHVWHAGWWVWHAARVAAYAILLVTAYQVIDTTETELRRLNHAVRAEQQRLTNVLDMLPAYVILLTPDYRVPFANRYFEERFGKSQGRRCFEYLFQRSEPCENCESFTVATTHAPHHWEWLGPDSRNYDIHDFPYTDSDGSALILEMGIDVTEQKAAQEQLRAMNRSLRAITHCNQLLLHATNEQELLQGVCRILVEECGHVLAWVGFPEHNENQTVAVAAAAGASTDYMQSGGVTWADEPRGWGPTGTAIRTGRVCVCDDTLHDPNFALWRERALERGFRSSIVFPLQAGTTTFAALSIYSPRSGGFPEEEKNLLAGLAENLSFGVTALRTRAQGEEAEQRLRYLAGIVENTDEAIIGKDLDGTIRSWNRGAEMMYGYTEAEMLGRNISCLEPPEHAGGIARILEKIRRGETVDHYETVRVRKDGTQVHISVTVSPIRDATGLIIGAAAIGRDITERKKAEAEIQRYTEELERSNAELQDFASIASHDLQEPLRKVLAFGEHLREQLGDNLDDLGKDFLGRMQNAAQRMSVLIESLLGYSRVTTRARPLQPVDPVMVMFGVLDDLQERIASARARIDFGALPKVMADPMQLRQVLQNLVANALKFQRPGTRPHVQIEGKLTDGNQWSLAAGENPDRPSTIDHRPGWCEISVRDNGIGFDEKYLDRIFRPFQRLHGRNEYEGSGMGLAICRKVIARHGGTITAHSRPNQGSTFVITLPLAPNMEREGEAKEEGRPAWLKETVVT